MRLIIATFLTAILSILIPFEAHTLGYRNPSIGPRGSSMAQAVAVDTESPEVIYYNPAGLMLLEGVDMSFGADFVVVDASHKNGPGTFESTGYTLFAVPDFYLGWNPNDKPFAMGIALNSPYGLGFDWGQNSFARLDIYRARLTLFNLQPTIAFAFTKYFSIGFGINIWIGSLDFRSKVDVGQVMGAPGPTGTEFDSRFKGTAAEQTMNIGAIWSPSDDIRVGLSYQSGKNIVFDGDLELSNIPPALQAAMGLPLDAITLGAKTTLIIPPILTFGIAYSVCPKLKVEFDFDWTRWSSFNSQSLTVPLNAALSQSIARNWEDSFFYRAGANYWLLDWLALRAGYAFAEKSIPDSTMEPGIPDYNRHIVAFGAGIKYQKYMINFSYNAVIPKANPVNNDVLNPYADLDGTYDSFAHIFSLGMEYQF